MRQEYKCQNWGGTEAQRSQWNCLGSHSPLGTPGVQSLSRVWLFEIPWTVAYQASLSITNSQSLLNSCPLSRDAIQPSHPLSSPSFPPSIFPRIRAFSNESVLHIRWPKDWSFSFSVSPSSEYSGLISFRMDWLDLLAVQGTLKSLLQLYGLKAINSLTLSFLYSPTHIHPWLLEKP